MLILVDLRVMRRGRHDVVVCLPNDILGIGLLLWNTLQRVANN